MNMLLTADGKIFPALIETVIDTVLNKYHFERDDFEYGYLKQSYSDVYKLFKVLLESEKEEDLLLTYQIFYSIYLKEIDAKDILDYLVSRKRGISLNSIKEYLTSPAFSNSRYKKIIAVIDHLNNVPIKKLNSTTDTGMEFIPAIKNDYNNNWFNQPYNNDIKNSTQVDGIDYDKNLYRISAKIDPFDINQEKQFINKQQAHKAYCQRIVDFSKDIVVSNSKDPNVLAPTDAFFKNTDILNAIRAVMYLQDYEYDQKRKYLSSDYLEIKNLNSTDEYVLEKRVLPDYLLNDPQRYPETSKIQKLIRNSNQNIQFQDISKFVYDVANTMVDEIDRHNDNILFKYGGIAQSISVYEKMIRSINFKGNAFTQWSKVFNNIINATKRVCDNIFVGSQLKQYNGQDLDDIVKKDIINAGVVPKKMDVSQYSTINNVGYNYCVNFILRQDLEFYKKSKESTSNWFVKIFESLWNGIKNFFDILQHLKDLTEYIFGIEFDVDKYFNNYMSVYLVNEASFLSASFRDMEQILPGGYLIHDLTFVDEITDYEKISKNNTKFIYISDDSYLKDISAWKSGEDYFDINASEIPQRFNKIKLVNILDLNNSYLSDDFIADIREIDSSSNIISKQLFKQLVMLDEYDNIIYKGITLNYGQKIKLIDPSNMADSSIFSINVYFRISDSMVSKLPDDWFNIDTAQIFTYGVDFLTEIDYNHISKRYDGATQSSDSPPSSAPVDIVEICAANDYGDVNAVQFIEILNMIRSEIIGSFGADFYFIRNALDIDPQYSYKVIHPNEEALETAASAILKKLNIFKNITKTTTIYQVFQDMISLLEESLSDLNNKYLDYDHLNQKSKYSADTTIPYSKTTFDSIFRVSLKKVCERYVNLANDKIEYNYLYDYIKYLQNKKDGIISKYIEYEPSKEVPAIKDDVKNLKKIYADILDYILDDSRFYKGV